MYRQRSIATSNIVSPVLQLYCSVRSVQTRGFDHLVASGSILAKTPLREKHENVTEKITLVLLPPRVNIVVRHHLPPCRLVALEQLN